MPARWRWGAWRFWGSRPGESGYCVGRLEIACVLSVCGLVWVLRWEKTQMEPKMARTAPAMPIMRAGPH